MSKNTVCILFVCHGNICRSVMAEMILRHLAEVKGLSSNIFVASRATSGEEITSRGGNPIYPPAAAELRRHGIPIADHRATRLVKEDYDRYDLILGMDGANMRNMMRLFGGDPSGKVRKLSAMTGEEWDVADPWYTDRFDLAYADIERGCLALIELLAEGCLGDI